MSVVEQAPHFTETEALAFIQQLYGMTGTIRQLPSERDQNFYCKTPTGEYVLKIANGAEDSAVLDFQNMAMTRLAGHIGNFQIPQLCPTHTEEVMTTVTSAGGARHLVRLLSYLPGGCLAQVNPHTPELLEEVGRMAGSLAAGLTDFQHPAMNRKLQWDLQYALELRPFTPEIENPARRTLVERWFDRFEQLLPQLGNLRRQVIYNDANDYNVLVSPPTMIPRHVIGTIDFGDMVYSHLICDVAVAAAYAMLGKPDPLSAALQVVRGYHSVVTLIEAELTVLYELICIRLCMSVTISAHQQRLAPDNSYLKISERPAWELLEQLAQINPAWAGYLFREACGYQPCAQSAMVVNWLQRHAAEIGSVVEADLHSEPLVVFDLSAASLAIESLTELRDTQRFNDRLFGEMQAADTTVGVGRYNEARLIYAADQFAVGGNEFAERRTVHLGIDLFLETNTPIFAPLAGVVHSFRNNNLPLDYGPTILLQHTVSPDGSNPEAAPLTFYTLYGHLTLDSLEDLYPGKPVARGEVIGRVGDQTVNGGWPPHVHIQIINDMLGNDGDFPGVGEASRRATWLSLCPDPNLLLQIPAERFPAPPLSTAEIGAIRKQHFGRSLSLSYQQPLTIVRGFMQYLYDENGWAYLDVVNNVPHVGHCHPRVVRAAQQQLAVLNTNTRYLHPNLARYIERLCATVPEPLSVVYLVNSGSEANELALRLARAYTGHYDVLVVDGDYHGHTNALIDISPYKFDGPGGSGAPRYTHKVLMPDPYRGPYRGYSTATGVAYARHVQQTIAAAQADERQIAAFFCESLLGCGGQHVLPDGYLQEAYHYVHAAGGVCVADEVQVGFGRVGTHFWGFETQGVVPDIVTMGKPIGNGHPMAAVITTPDIAAAFDQGMEYFNTFGGNPVSCAVGLAVLDVIANEQLQQKALTLGQQLRSGLEQLKERHTIIGDVRGLGLFLGVELVLDRETLAPAAAQAGYIAERMKQRGILINTEGPYHNVLKIKPPLAFNQADVERLIATLDMVLAEDFVRQI